MHILCAGGGTLGSVTPLLAVVEELKRQGLKFTVEWWGTGYGPERVLVENFGLPFHALPAGKLRRYWSVKNISDSLRVCVGFVRAVWLFRTQRPSVVLTAGGYVAVPVGWAAWCYGVPVVVHQQDVRPGLANKLLAPIATRITVTFASSLAYFPKAKTVITGNPVRQGFITPISQEQARRELGLEPNTSTLVVVGGGTGALFINELVKRTLAELTQVAQVVHQTGENKGVGQLGNGRYTAVPFALASQLLLQAADVVVTRAGMAYLTELGALHKACIVIPIPHGHQEDNAALLDQHKAAVILPQESLTDRWFVDTVRELMSKAATRHELGANLGNLFPVTAVVQMADEVKAVLAARP